MQQLDAKKDQSQISCIWAFLLLTLIIMSSAGSTSVYGQLSKDWVLEINGRCVSPNLDGTFSIDNIIAPDRNADFISDTAWTYAMYLESAALLPQLYMFQKQSSGVVELLTAHFVFALGFGRVMEFLFWIYSYHELADASGSKLPGYLALFSQAVQLIMMLDFFWYYYLAVKNATPLVLPSHGGMGIV